MVTVNDEVQPTSRPRPEPAWRRPERGRTVGHVKWDEKVIAEHDKERGTRQKIDEPDTPWARSPQASDSEDERRPKTAEDSSLTNGEGQPPGSADARALAHRLNDWVSSGGGRHRADLGGCSTGSSEGDCGDAADVECSHPSSAGSSRSSSRAASRGGADRHISLPEDQPQPKPTSDVFKAKRAQHYNEIAALRAFAKDSPGSPASPESSSGDTEHESDTVTKTNTNTNRNLTIRKAGVRPATATAAGEGGEGDVRGDSDARGDGDARGSGERERAVCFPDSSGAESSEDFRHQRRRHYSSEWSRDPLVQAAVGSLETNTNTNLNARCGAGGVSRRNEAPARNPMEAGRPPVQIVDAGGGGAESSEEFREGRRRHYDEVEAVRRFRMEHASSRDDAEEEESEEQDDEDDEEEVPSAELGHRGLGGGGASPSGRGRRGGRRGRMAAASAALLANPSEPWQGGVMFQVNGLADGSGGGNSRGDSGDGPSREEWRRKRGAHYSEMAAALRAAPPPSDDEEDPGDEDPSAGGTD